MLQLFRNDYFRYNGKDSSEMCNLVLCDLSDEAIVEIQNGLSRQTENADKNGYVSVTNNTIKSGFSRRIRTIPRKPVSAGNSWSINRTGTGAFKGRI